MEPPETITVKTRTVGCNGGGGSLGHPKVYLTLDRSSAIDCPYCGRRYLLDPEVTATDGAH